MQVHSRTSDFPRFHLDSTLRFPFSSISIRILTSGAQAISTDSLGMLKGDSYPSWITTYQLAPECAKTPAVVL